MAHGHRLADIWGYSLRTIQVFMDVILVRLRQQLHDVTVAVRHSQGTDARVFREFLDSLKEEE